MNQTKSRYTWQSFKFRAAGAVCAFSLLVSTAGAQADDAAQAPAADNAAGATVKVETNPTTDLSTAGGASADGVGKVILKPGQPIAINSAAEDLQPTDDADLAKKQLDAYPDNPEAAFILAVALTRTSRVEDALKEVRHARQLAEAKGGAQYFDKMIGTYEKMLAYCPDENRVRYTLAWAYYMKAYLLMQDAKRAARDAAPVAAQPAPPAPEKGKNVNAAMASGLLNVLSPQLAGNLPTSGKVSSTQLPRLKGALEQTPPSAVPQVKHYYEAALKNLDDLLAKKPDDIWARVYRAHLNAEYTGDLAAAMTVWKDCEKMAPQNPAPYFFLGTGYLKEGDLKESISNISRAIALRALGN